MSRDLPEHGDAAANVDNVVPYRGDRQDMAVAPHAGPYVYEDYDEEGFDFWGAVKVLIQRKWLILAIVSLGVSAAALLTLRETPVFKSTTTIEIQREERQIFEGAGVDPVVVADAEYMATQYALLQSRSLAERVAELLNLPSDQRYADQELSRTGRLNAAAASIRNNLRIAPEGRSRLINITYESPYPRETARIANAIAENFIEANLERRYNSTAYARTFLEERLQTTKALLETSERALVAYAEEEGIIDLSGAGGSDAGDSLDAAALMALNASLTEAQDDRIRAEQMFAEAIDNPNTRAILENEAVRQLTDRRAMLEADYQEKLGKFKPQYPDMVLLTDRIAALDQQINNEIAKIIAALGADFRAARAREASLRDRVQTLKTQVQDLKTRSINYNILKREVDTNRSQYEALLQRLKEVSLSSGVGSNQVAIIDRALTPLLPFSPNVSRTLLQALVLSVAAGVGLAFALNYIDDTIKTPDDVKDKLGLAAIGVIPKGNDGAIVEELVQDPRSRLREAFSSARTALQYSTANGAPKSLLVTGSRPAEGKTSTTVGLALSFANAGARVLIVDADMRKPSFASPHADAAGLSALLAQDGGRLEDCIVPSPDSSRVFLLPSGVVPPDPAELLASPRLRHLIAAAEDIFDLVLVDSSPVMDLADAPLLSGVCQGTVLVLQSGAIRRADALRSIERLETGRAKMLGVMLTKFNEKRHGYGYGYGYGYGDRYGPDMSSANDIDPTLASDAAGNRRITLFLDHDARS